MSLCVYLQCTVGVILRQDLKSYNNVYFQDFLTSQGVYQQIYEISPNDLDQLLGTFFTNVRKENGDDYEPRYLKNMHFSLDRHMRHFNYPFCITKDPEFRGSQSLIKARQRELFQMGKGSLTPHCLPLRDDDIDLFFAVGQMGDSSPDSLLNTMWFMNSCYFRVKSSKDHHTLRWGDVTLTERTDLGGLACLEMQKSAQVSSSHSVLHLYEERMTPARCFVTLYRKYKAKRPAQSQNADDPFYLCPDPNWKSTRRWYWSVPLYMLRLQNMMKRMAEAAGIPKQRRLTNNSVFLHRQLY